MRRAQATALDRHHHRLTSGQFQYGVKRNVEGLPAIDWSDQKARQTQVACNARTVLHFASKHLVYLRADQQHDVSSTRRLRAWKTNLLQVLQAVLFVFVIWAVDKAITYSRERMPAFSQVHSPSATAVASIPDCAQNQYLKACSILRPASCCFKALLLSTASSCASLDYAVTCWSQPLLYASLHAHFACAACVPCNAVIKMCCLQQGADCLTFLYTPDNDTSVDSIIAAMRSNNSPAIPDSRTKGFGSMSEVTNTPCS